MYSDKAQMPNNWLQSPFENLYSPEMVAIKIKEKKKKKRKLN